MNLKNNKNNIKSFYLFKSNQSFFEKDFKAFYKILNLKRFKGLSFLKILGFLSVSALSFNQNVMATTMIEQNDKKNVSFIEQDYKNEKIENLSFLKTHQKNNDFIFQTKLFKLTIDGNLGFQQRYDILDAVQENKAFGITTVNEKGKISHTGLFGSFEANNIEEFSKKIEKNKQFLAKNTKMVEGYEVRFSTNALKYEKSFKDKDIKKIGKEIIGDNKGLILIFEAQEEGNKELLAFSFNQKNNKASMKTIASLF